jgi:hypothetical protein
MEQDSAQLVHARKDDGSILCGKDGAHFEKSEFSAGPYWHEVNCPSCNEHRRLNLDEFANIYLREAR